MSSPSKGSVPSPYELALGYRLQSLHPRLRAYFGAIPAGSIGRGRGTFEKVGTGRKWLWPVLWMLGRQGVVFPVDRADVPFTVENRPVVDGAGNTAVDAVRAFDFPGGRRHMIDAITAENGSLVDHLGVARRYVAFLDGRVDSDGFLALESTGMAVRLGNRRVPVPAWFAPRVTLTESVDTERDRQRVSVVIDMPFFGRLYEYTGDFDYAVGRDDSTQDRRPGEDGK